MAIRHHHSGFTLIELMIVMAVAGALLVVAVPAFNNSLLRNSINAETSRIVSSLNYARSEAVARGSVVTMSHKGAANDWSDGWRTYTDAEAGGNTAYTNGVDVLLKDVAGASAKLTVISTATATPQMSFRPNGMLNPAGITVSIAICAADNSVQGRLISINVVGRVSVANAVTCTP